MDRLAAIETFVTVARTGSFSAAADQLRVSRSLVSKRIRELEERVGARLLHRTTRQVSTTAVGQSYFERCSGIMADLDGLDHQVGVLGQGPGGSVRLRATHSITVLVLSPVIAKFGERYPEIKLALVVSDEPESLDLAEGAFDLAIRLAPLPDSGVVARKLMPMPWHLVAAPGYLDRRGTPLRVAELAAHSCLMHTAQAPINIWRFNGPQGPESVRVDPRLLSNSVITLRDSAVQGLGVALLPAFGVGNDLRSGKLVELLSGHDAPERPLCILFSNGRMVPGAVRLFVDFLQHWMATHGAVKPT